MVDMQNLVIRPEGKTLDVDRLKDFESIKRQVDALQRIHRATAKTAVVKVNCHTLGESFFVKLTLQRKSKSNGLESFEVSFTIFEE